VESKNVIKSLLISEKKIVVKESTNIPLSSMLKIASNVFNTKYENISEEEKNELKSLLSLSKKETKNQVISLTEEVVQKLQSKLNEEEDKEIQTMIEATISRVKDSKEDLVSLYKLKQLNSGL
jgi:DNA-binding transcriptional regulator GbsR (MarR family)